MCCFWDRRAQGKPTSVWRSRSSSWPQAIPRSLPRSRTWRRLWRAPRIRVMRKPLRRYTTPRVLVIDEVGYTKLSPAQAHHFFALVTARDAHGSILLTSNTSFSNWGSLLGDEVLATALLDRLLHHAEVISITGPSYRMKDRREAALKTTGGGQK